MRRKGKRHGFPSNKTIRNYIRKLGRKCMDDIGKELKTEAKKILIRTPKGDKQITKYIKISESEEEAANECKSESESESEIKEEIVHNEYMRINYPYTDNRHKYKEKQYIETYNVPRGRTKNRILKRTKYPFMVMSAKGRAKRGIEYPLRESTAIYYQLREEGREYSPDYRLAPKMLTRNHKIKQREFREYICDIGEIGDLDPGGD